MYRNKIAKCSSRVDHYLDALERDEAVNHLKRTYARNCNVQAEYEDLRAEIVKAQQENVLLEERNRQIQDTYLNKIKDNKILLAQLVQQIEDLEATITQTVISTDQKHNINEELVRKVRATKSKIDQVQEQKNDLNQAINEEDQMLARMENTMVQLLTIKKNTQIQNQQDRDLIEQEVKIYKQQTEQLKAQEIQNQSIRVSIQAQNQNKEKLKEKENQQKDLIAELTHKLSYCEKQKQKLGYKAQELDEEVAKVKNDAMINKQNIVKWLSKNNEQTEQLKRLENILKEATNVLCLKQTQKQKYSVHITDLTKTVDKLQVLEKTLDQQIEDNEQINKGLITNLKKSIESDQEAVKTLLRKAAFLNTLAQS